ncbi:MAG: tRNA dihydrouridine(20/20a) synthase DusA [Kiloniellales bacterium]
MPTGSPPLSRRLSVAPMMDWTDRHDRYFLRLITRRTLLYTEMVPVQALAHGDPARWLSFDPAEKPLALQLGGAEPAALAHAAGLAGAFGFDEVNLNLGCPSDRVQQARFGACLMAEPALVAQLYRAMAEATALPVTVKTRIGIDERDSYDELAAFVGRIAEAGCRTFTIHARKAWLSGLSPKQNRDVPPLEYERVYRLKRDFPQLEIVVNGGMLSLDQAESALSFVDGAMIGRAAYQTPYVLAEADRRFFGETQAPPRREEIARALVPYLARRRAEGVPVKAVTRHVLGLFNGLPGARAWRRSLSELDSSAGPEAVEQALMAREAALLRRAA